jgi:hypothetical protein
MKAADISNEARPFPVSKVWADALMKEYLSFYLSFTLSFTPLLYPTSASFTLKRYFAQSNLEKQRQLPVTPFMDPDKVKISQTQVNFIDSFLLPTFRLLNKVVPEFQPFVDGILENRRRWSETAS